MPTNAFITPQPLDATAPKLWLNMCAWKVPAGFPSPAADHTQKRIDLNDHLIRNKEATFIFKVKGDSMVGVGIYEGDALVIDRSIEAKHNNIVLAVLNNEFTVKRLYRRGGVVKLVAGRLRIVNTKMSPSPSPSMWLLQIGGIGKGSGV